MVASRPSPALTATNLPASCANRSAMARALRRRTATPVRINAPVSTSSRRILAVFVLLVDKRSERFDIDPGVVDVGCQQYLRFVQDVAFGDAITRTFEGQFEPGEIPRCDVEEPISTPTLVSRRFSSSCMWRLALENEPLGAVAMKILRI